MFWEATISWRTETICFRKEMGKVTTAMIGQTPVSYPNRETVGVWRVRRGW